MAIPLTVNITAVNKLRNSAGELISSGTLTVFPVSPKTNNFGYRSGNGELVLNSATTRKIVDGVMVGSLVVDNSQITNPGNFGYNFVFQDLTSNQTVQFTQVLVSPDINGNFDISNLVGASATALPVLYRTGPQGIPGIVGILNLSASQNISAYQVVACINGYAAIASNTVAQYIGNILGVATTGTVSGQNVTIQYSGLLTYNGWNWNLNSPIYLGSGGLLTQNAPSNGFIQVIATPVKSNEILLNMQSPIIIN